MAKTKDMTIVYYGPIDEITVPLPDGTAARVARGGSLVTSAEFAGRLLEQDIWQPIPAAKPKNEGSE